MACVPEIYGDVAQIELLSIVYGLEPFHGRQNITFRVKWRPRWILFRISMAIFAITCLGHEVGRVFQHYLAEVFRGRGGVNGPGKTPP